MHQNKNVIFFSGKSAVFFFATLGRLFCANLKWKRDLSFGCCQRLSKFCVTLKSYKFEFKYWNQQLNAHLNLLDFVADLYRYTVQNYCGCTCNCWRWAELRTSSSQAQTSIDFNTKLLISASATFWNSTFRWIPSCTFPEVKLAAFNFFTEFFFVDETHFWLHGRRSRLKCQIKCEDQAKFVRQ